MHIYSGELKKWLRITFNLHEGSWQRARRFTAALTDGATEASSIGWEGVTNPSSGQFRTGGTFPHEWISTVRSFVQGSPRPCDTLRS